jgi:ethanolamine ammonia-lyase large subunit
MLNYQSTSFHDALYVRGVFDLRPAPEFEAWFEQMRQKLPRMAGAFRMRRRAGPSE